MTTTYGEVVNWNKDRGFGFVRPDSGGNDVFLHVAELDGVQPSRIRTGVRVEFSTVQGDRGLKAVGVRLDTEVRLDEGGDFLSAEEYGREVTAILDEAGRKLQRLARQHNWIE